MSDEQTTETKSQGVANPSKSPKPGGVATPDTRRGLGAFLSEVQRETKRISWPTPKEATRLTSTVVGVCLLVVTVLFIFSIGIEAVLGILLGRN